MAAAGLAAVGPAAAKTIQFSGYTWEARSGAGGPGPNAWSEDNAWVDKRGRLHLKIAKRDGQWSCAELTMNKRIGIGRYEFDVDSPVETLDDNVVLGLFNYTTPDIGPDGTNEIDIEFATWGGGQRSHGNWTVWPALPGVAQSAHIFDFAAPTGRSVNSFTWSQNRVEYAWNPVGNAGSKGERWTYAPEDYRNRIPQHPLPVHINLWLFNGKPPADDKEVEVIISTFKFTPAASSGS